MAKIKYKKVKQLTPTQAAYLAGLIDGEGTVALTRMYKGGHRRVGITISNTELPMLQWVLEAVGVGQITNKRVYKKEWTPSYAYQAYSQQALDILDQVVPYLMTYKKKRAELVLRDYKRLTPRNGKYSMGVLGQREKFVEMFFNIKTPHSPKVKV